MNIRLSSLVLFIFLISILSADTDPLSLTLIARKMDRYTFKVTNQTDMRVDIERIEGG